MHYYEMHVCKEILRLVSKSCVCDNAVRSKQHVLLVTNGVVKVCVAHIST